MDVRNLLGQNLGGDGQKNTTLQPCDWNQSRIDKIVLDVTNKVINPSSERTWNLSEDGADGSS